MRLALTDLFKARWTDAIHSEWIRNVLKDRPDLTLEQLTRTKNLMNSHVRDCLVTGYETLIPGLQLNFQIRAIAMSSQQQFVVMQVL